MKLISAQVWREKYFAPESRPAAITDMRWPSSDKIPGRKVGGAWYVDEHAWLADGDELVVRVLSSGNLGAQAHRDRAEPALGGRVQRIVEEHRLRVSLPSTSICRFSEYGRRGCFACGSHANRGGRAGSASTSGGVRSRAWPLEAVED